MRHLLAFGDLFAAHFVFWFGHVLYLGKQQYFEEVKWMVENLRIAMKPICEFLVGLHHQKLIGTDEGGLAGR